MDVFDASDLLGRFPDEDAAYGAAVDAISECCDDPALPGCWE